MAYSSYDGWVTLQGSKCKCNCFATFSLRSKSSTLVCIFGDCNMRLLFTSRKKTTSVLLLRYVCSYIKTNGLFRAIFKRGNRGIGESGNRGIGEWGNGGMGEWGNGGMGMGEWEWGTGNGEWGIFKMGNL